MSAFEIRSAHPNARSLHRLGVLPSSMRAGYTIVEMFTAAGCIALLASLLLPAVQFAIQATRATQCLNNLRQLGIGLSQYHDSHGSFPAAGFEWWPGEPKFFSPHAKILPFLGLSSIHELIDESTVLYDRGDTSKLIQLHSAAAIRVGLFLCPADGVSSRNYPGNSYRCNLGVKSYHWAAVDPTGPHGGFDEFHSVRRNEFTDGLSKTVLMSERLIGSFGELYEPSRDLWFPKDVANTFPNADFYRSYCRNPPSDNPPSERFTGAIWITGSYRNTWYNHILAPNSETPDCTAAETLLPLNSLVSARSMHAGTINVLLGDGGARVVHETMNLAAWQSLATRNGGESSSD